jgi:hypothetical protein
MDLGIGVIESISNKKKCSRCQVIGHNATSCHLPPAEDSKSKDQMSDQSQMEPGEYLMGEDPMVPLVQAHCLRVKAALRINDTDFFFLAHLTQSNYIGPFWSVLHHYMTTKKLSVWFLMQLRIYLEKVIWLKCRI